jgi:MFS family permease
MTHNVDRTAQRIVVVSAISLFIIFGIRLSFSVFFAEFVLEEGWSNEASATIFSLNMLVFAITAPLAGLSLDRYGARLVFGVGALCLAVGLLLSSYANTLDDLKFAYGVVGGIGLGIVGLGPVAAIISGWIPPAQRGRAIGIAFAGTGLGSLIFVPFANFLIEQFAWRNAYLVLALICFFVLTPLMVIGLKSPPNLISSKAQDSQPTTHWKTLLTNPIFWALMLVSLTALGPLRSLTVHQIAYMETVGIDRQLSANIVGLAGFLTASTFIGWGWVSDKFGRVVAFTLGAFSLLGAVAMLLVIRDNQTIGLLIMYAILYALGEGTRSSQTTALASDVFQKQGLGLINGLVGGMFGLGAAFGPWLVGRIKDETGQYDGGFAVVVIMIVISIIGFVVIALSNQRKVKNIH